MVGLLLAIVHEGFFVWKGQTLFDVTRELLLLNVAFVGGVDDAVLLPLLQENKDKESDDNKEEEEEEEELLPLLEQKERKIAFVHIGKAGGMTVRRSTALLCLLPRFKSDQTGNEQRCLQKYFDPSDNKLSLQTRTYFHLWGYNEEQMQNATTFLVPLRNPVDRIISTFKYSHPENCHNGTILSKVIRPWGCEVLESKYYHQTRSPQYKLYRLCFPSATMLEDFAQSTMSPWQDFSHNQNLSGHHQQQWQCRKIARDAVRGKGKLGTLVSLTAPHMYYNHEYYAKHSIWKYPNREIFGIRTDHEWEDMVNLDLMLGGTGNFSNHGKAESHGSDKYKKARISQEAYRKLCCVLEKEIDIFLNILKRVENLTHKQKQETIDSLYDKCGIHEEVGNKKVYDNHLPPPTLLNATSFTVWQQQCQRRIEADRKPLEKAAVQANDERKENAAAKKNIATTTTTTTRLPTGHFRKQPQEHF